MLCRWAPLGCRIVDDIENILEHEKTDHSSFVSTEKLFDLLGDYRTVQARVVEVMSRRKNSKRKVSEQEEENNISVPFIADEKSTVKIIDLKVFADMSDEKTFPGHMVDYSNDSNHSNFRLLKYPNVVIENGHHNSRIHIHFQTNRIDQVQFGLINAKGDYLRRLVRGSRHSVISVSESEMFQVIELESLGGKDSYRLTLQFADFSGDQNVLEGHYRDLRFLLFCMNENVPVITSVDASIVMRISPNADYLSEKRLPIIVGELGWDEPVPATPPMMGSKKPTMRISF